MSDARLNGQVYTPLALARDVVAAMRWPGDGDARCIDPACGDGVFLQAAVEHLVARGRPDAIARLQGFDIDPDAVAAARTRLDGVCAELGVRTRPKVMHCDALQTPFEADAVIGNPPYLEAKRMPDALKQRIRASCPVSATGAFDLYGAFIERAVRSLAPGGELAFIVPNRVLVTRATGRLRRWLGAQGRIGVVDLSEERVFAGVGVYPVVLRLDGATAPRWCLESLAGTAGFCVELDELEQLGGRMPLPAPPMRPVLRRLLDTPLRFGPLGRAIEVKWTVSFHRRGLRDAFVFEERPRSEHARRFLGGVRFAGNREVAPYGIEWSGTWIDYDQARARAERNPLPPPELFDRPHVVIPQNVRRPRAAINRAGYVLKDTFLAATLREGADPAWLAWLTLVLNTTFGHHLYEALFGGTRKGGGYLQMLGSYLHHLPIPAPPTESDALHDALMAAPGHPELRDRAEHLVRTAYEVSPGEDAALQSLRTPDA